MSHFYVYASGWTHGRGKGGIGLFTMDAESGALSFVEKFAAGIDFNVTLFDAGRALLYALNTGSDLPGLRGGGGGRVFVFRADPATGRLTQIGCTPLWSSNPAQLSLDASGKYLVVANHGTRSTVTKVKKDAFGRYYPCVERDDSTVELFAIEDDGCVGELLDVVYHVGSGPEWRQASAHPHSCEMSPDGRFFVVCDKGRDTVTMYRIDSLKHKLIRFGDEAHHAPATLPRYVKFHPTLPCFYHNNEACMDLHAFRYDDSGHLELIDTCTSLPDGDRAPKKEGEVYEQQCLVMHPNGRYLYDVARGPNCITVFSLDPYSGIPRCIQHVFTEGQWPRGLALSPDGRFMLLCNVNSHEIEVYSVGVDGLLSPTGHKATLECAAYATFWKP